MLATFPILVVLNVSLSTGTPADFDKLIEKARTSFLSYDLNSAERAYLDACPTELAQSLPLSRVAFCEHGLGAVADLRGNGADAVRHYAKALTNWEHLGDEYLPHRITTLTSLGSAYRRQGRVAEAENVLGQALDLVKPLAGSRPELYGAVLIRRGALYAEPGPGRAMLNEAIAVLSGLPEPNRRELALASNALGMLNLSVGRDKEGELNLRRAVEFANSSLGENHPETATYATNLALALLAQGQANRAEPLLRRSRLVIESHAGPDSLQLVNTLTALTSAEAALGRFGISRDYGERALAILDSHGAGSAEKALVQVNLGALYLREGKTAEAETILTAAVDEERRVFGTGRKLGDGIRMLALLRAQQQAWEKSESLYRETIRVYESSLGPDHPDIAPVLREFAMVMKHRRAPRELVRNLEARAKAIGNSGTRE